MWVEIREALELNNWVCVGNYGTTAEVVANGSERIMNRFDTKVTVEIRKSSREILWVGLGLSVRM